MTLTDCANALSTDRLIMVLVIAIIAATLAAYQAKWPQPKNEE